MLEGKKGGGKYYNDERCRIFDSIPLHNWGGAAVYATIYRLNQVQYQQCCYDFSHKIAATSGCRLEVVTYMSLQ